MTQTDAAHPTGQIKDEPWQPVDGELYAPAALDIVSMLLQVSKGYFMNELPVSEDVMKQLAEKFGLLMQVRPATRRCRRSLM